MPRQPSRVKAYASEHGLTYDQARYRMRVAGTAKGSAERQAARGHGTTAEHGISQRANVYEVYRTGDVDKALTKAIKQHGDKVRVEITTYKANGDSRQVLKETRPGRAQRGVTATAIRDRMQAGESFRTAVTNVMHGRRYKNDKRWQNVTRVHIRVVSEGE